MSSDTVIPALGHSRPGALRWQVGGLDERADRSGHLDQSQKQALGLDYATIQRRVASLYLAPSLESNQNTPDSRFATGNVRDQKSGLFRFDEMPASWTEGLLSDDWKKIQSAAAPPESQRILSPDSSEVWEGDDDTRFDLLVERELSRQLTTSEREELEVLNQKRNRTLARVSNEEMDRENLKEAALIELQNLIDKYAPLFDRRA